MDVYPNYYKKISLLYKKIFHPINIKKFLVPFNIRMINLSFDELRLIAQIRNGSDYESKSKEDLIEALSKIKPKPQTPKPEPKPQTPEPKPEITVNKRKLEKLRKDFDELRHKFSEKEIDRYRKAFYNVKNLSMSEIKEASKNLTKLIKSLKFKKFRGNIDSVDYEDLDNYDYNYDFADG